MFVFIFHFSKGTLFTGGVDGRDPMVLDLEAASSPNPFPFRYIIYYCGTNPDDATISNVNHVTYYRTSNDLLTWSPIVGIAFDGGVDGNNFGGPTESPFVVRRGDFYYLFSGAWGNDYTDTRVFVSKDPRDFGSVPLGTASQVGEVVSHAPEVVRDLAGKWYVSSAGWGAGGVYLSELTWSDGCDNSCPTNLPVPSLRHPSTPNFVTNLHSPFFSSSPSPFQFNVTQSGLVGGCPLDNAFYISSSYVPSTSLSLNCSFSVNLVTFNGNPTSDPTSQSMRIGSAAGIVFSAKNPSDPLSGSNVLNLFTNNYGGVKLFAFPYKEYEIVEQPIEQDVTYHVTLMASRQRVTVSIDGVTLLDYSGQSIDISGNVGVYVWQSAAFFQNVTCVF